MAGIGVQFFCLDVALLFFSLKLAKDHTATRLEIPLLPFLQKEFSPTKPPFSLLLTEEDCQTTSRTVLLNTQHLHLSSTLSPSLSQTDLKKKEGGELRPNFSWSRSLTSGAPWRLGLRLHVQGAGCAAVDERANGKFESLLYGRGDLLHWSWEQC